VCHKRGRPKGSETTVIGVAKKWIRKGKGVTKENCGQCGFAEPPKGLKGKKRIQWIQCDGCKKCLHRSCCTTDLLPNNNRDPFDCQFCSPLQPVVRPKCPLINSCEPHLATVTSNPLKFTELKPIFLVSLKTRLRIHSF